MGTASFLKKPSVACRISELFSPCPKNYKLVKLALQVIMWKV